MDLDWVIDCRGELAWLMWEWLLEERMSASESKRERGVAGMEWAIDWRGELTRLLDLEWWCEEWTFERLEAGVAGSLNPGESFHFSTSGVLGVCL